MDVNELVEYVKKALGDIEVKNIDVGKDVVHVEVDIKDVVEAAKRLKKAGFDHVKDVTAIDYKKDGYILIVYHASSYSNKDLSKHIVGLAYRIPRDQERVPTLYYVWTSADFYEREVYEGFGIVFEGHPDLRPLLLAPPVAEQKPLRKDFVVREAPIFKK